MLKTLNKNKYMIEAILNIAGAFVTFWALFLIGAFVTSWALYHSFKNGGKG